MNYVGMTRHCSARVFYLIPVGFKKTLSQGDYMKAPRSASALPPEIYAIEQDLKCYRQAIVSLTNLRDPTVEDKAALDAFRARRDVLQAKVDQYLEEREEASEAKAKRDASGRQQNKGPKPSSFKNDLQQEAEFKPSLDFDRNPHSRE
jgi:hypothetical protein